MLKKVTTGKIFWITIPTLIFFVVIFLFYHAGTFLVRRDKLVKGDAILILMGSIADRVLEASDIYNAKYADNLLIVEENMEAVELLLSRGAHLLSNTTQCRNIAVELGIPLQNITIIPGGATSTIMEAKLVSNFIRQSGNIDTLLVVTSPSHSRRAGWIISKTFQKYKLSITVITCPSKYDSYTGIRCLFCSDL